MSMAIVAVGVAAVGIGVGAYESSQQQGIANDQIGLARQTQGEQMQWNQQLHDLINNPQSFLSSPLYQAAFGQGTQAVGRSQAASGFLNSGNSATALQQFGQSFAGQQLLGQEQLIAPLTGTGNASSPSQGYAGASASNNAAFNQYGGLLASLGYSSANNMGTGASMGGGNTMDAGGGYTFSY